MNGLLFPSWIIWPFPVVLLIRTVPTLLRSIVRLLGDPFMRTTWVRANVRVVSGVSWLMIMMVVVRSRPWVSTANNRGLLGFVLISVISLVDGWADCRLVPVTVLASIDVRTCVCPGLLLLSIVMRILLGLGIEALAYVGDCRVLEVLMY